MHNKYEELKSKVETAEWEEIETIGKEVYDILNEIKKRTLTIAEEENLIEQIYALLYDCIKKEIIFSIGSNEPLYLLERVKIEKSISYITALIKKEIKEKPSKEINEKVQKIDQLGLQDENYLDKELIFLLSVHEGSKNIVESLLSEELESLDKKEYELVNMQEKETELNLKIMGIRKAKGKTSRKRMVKQVLTYLSLGVADGTRN